MIPWQVIVALLLIALTGYYAYEMNKNGGSCRSSYVERFVNYSNVDPEGLMDEKASVNQGPLLEGTLMVHTGLSNLTAGSCASQDRARQMELGGQYVQRTNNYRRSYPDNCSAPLTDFVDSIYAPNNGVGLSVPCDGSC